MSSPMAKSIKSLWYIFLGNITFNLQKTLLKLLKKHSNFP